MSECRNKVCRIVLLPFDHPFIKQKEARSRKWAGKDRPAAGISRPEWIRYLTLMVILSDITGGS
jgi:hypothetical protein